MNILSSKETQKGAVPVDVFSNQQLKNYKSILKKGGFGMVSVYFANAGKTPVEISEVEPYYKISISSKEAGFILEEIRKVWQSNLEEKKYDKDFLDALVEKWGNYYRFLRGGKVSASTDVDPAN